MKEEQVYDVSEGDRAQLRNVTMCSKLHKICFCKPKASALCVAVYKLIFTLVGMILSIYAAVLYQEIPEHYDGNAARIHRVIGNSLIASAVFCFLLVAFHLMLLVAVIRGRAAPIRWWVRIMSVVEVLTCSAMFVTTWDTLRSFCLILNFALNIFLLREVCAYERSLHSGTKASRLEETDDEDEEGGEEEEEEKGKEKEKEEEEAKPSSA